MAADFAAMGQLSARYFASPEGQEGIAAFAAKRTPRWAE
jgi:methylglutaconyl-CoA hydratase